MVETETRATICKSWMPPPILFFLLRARGSFVFFRVQKGERGHTVNGYFRRETPLSSLSLVFSSVPSCRRTTVSILKRAKRDRSSSPPSRISSKILFSRRGTMRGNEESGVFIHSSYQKPRYSRRKFAPIADRYLHDKCPIGRCRAPRRSLPRTK